MSTALQVRALGSRLHVLDNAERAWLTADFEPAIGLDLPRHWYHVGWVVHAAPELGRRLKLQTLQLGNDLCGAAELHDLAFEPGLDPAQRAAAAAALVANALPRRADPAAPLMVELPGPRDALGQSPFWDGLGRHFYPTDPAVAEQRFGEAWRSHVAALLPRQLVYCAFLPESAQAAIGQLHGDALPVAQALAAAGMRWSRHVRPDDGGPVLLIEPTGSGLPR